MNENDEFIGRVEDYLVEFDGSTPLPRRVIDAIHAELPRTRQVKAGPGFMRMPPMLSKNSSRSPRRFTTFAKLSVTAVAVLAIGFVGLTIVRPPQPGGVGGQPIPSPSAHPSMTAAAPTSTPTAAAGPVDCENPNREVRDRVPIGEGIVGEAGTILGCSRDGTRLLIQKGLDQNLFVLHADGSETQLTDELSGLNYGAGSARPRGATISPDGSRVVFAGLTKRESSCHHGALFAVDADGGPAELLWTSQSHNGIVRYPAFSPDGTQVAFADGYCDSDHSVWVMNADGSDAHQIVTPIGTPLGGGWVRGLAWSPAGDRIALQYQGFDPGFEGLALYTFATDGSGFTKGGDASEFCWPGLGC